MAPSSEDGPPSLVGEPRLVQWSAFMAHAYAEGWYAGQIQTALHDVSRRFGRRKPRLRVFRDRTDVPATARLWPELRGALDESEWLVYLASPLAAASTPVADEIYWWLLTKPADRILIVWIDGTWAWDAAARDFDFESSSAINPALKQVFAHQPKIVDFRWATPKPRLVHRLRQSFKTTEPDSPSSFRNLSLGDERFLDVVADLASPLLDVPKHDVLQGARHRRLRRRVAAVAVTTAGLMATATLVTLLRRWLGP